MTVAAPAAAGTHRAGAHRARASRRTNTPTGARAGTRTGVAQQDAATDYRSYYRSGVRAMRRTQMLHRLLPFLHAWPTTDSAAAREPERGSGWQRCTSCGLTRTS